MKNESSRKNSFFRLELLILAALNTGDCYGYEIASMIMENTDNLFSIKEGVLYPILYKLNAQEYISLQSAIVKGRNRIYYHLEPKGRAHLAELAGEYLNGEDLVNAFLVHTGTLIRTPQGYAVVHSNEVLNPSPKR